MLNQPDNFLNQIVNSFITINISYHEAEKIRDIARIANLANREESILVQKTFWLKYETNTLEEFEWTVRERLREKEKALLDSGARTDDSQLMYVRKLLERYNQSERVQTYERTLETRRAA